MPENTIPAMLNAVKLGAKTLELDVVISADGKVVVSHDPYMSANFMTKPDGSEISKDEEKSLALYQMNYDSIRRYTSGIKPHPMYPGQMKIITHKISEAKTAEIVSDELIIHSAEDGLELMANLYYQDFDKIIIHEKNIVPDFFELKNGIAGEILQKFSNYRVRLAIVGDFTKYNSNSLNEFIYESNKGKQVAFVSSVIDAVKVLS